MASLSECLFIAADCGFSQRATAPHKRWKSISQKTKDTWQKTKKQKTKAESVSGMLSPVTLYWKATMLKSLFSFVQYVILLGRSLRVFSKCLCLCLCHCHSESVNSVSEFWEYEFCERIQVWILRMYSVAEREHKIEWFEIVLETHTIKKSRANATSFENITN